MGRESNDPIVVTQSSIALLQERFRQLQRAKEMREERELHLHKMAVEPKLFSPTMQYDCYETSSARLFFHFLPTRTSAPSPQVSLSLWTNSQSKQQVQVREDHFQIQCMETPPLLPTSETVPAAAAAAAPYLHASSEKFETPNHHDDDVDTSLHL